MAEVILVKLLAERGIASRRESERLIRQGLVQVDGSVQDDPAVAVDPRTQKILFDGEPLPRAPQPMTLLLHKPKGTITSREDPEGRETIFNLVDPRYGRLNPVGRLDYNTEGVLLLTNEGELAHRLTHPSYGVPKAYLVKVSGTPDERKLKAIAKGVPLEDGPSAPATVQLVRSAGPSSWLLLVIREGRNRIVRRIMDHLGHRTLKLKRVAFGGIVLRGVKPGRTRELSRGELDHLRRLVREPSQAELKVTWAIRKAVAEALRLPPPEDEHRARMGSAQDRHHGPRAGQPQDGG